MRQIKIAATAVALASFAWVAAVQAQATGDVQAETNAQTEAKTLDDALSSLLDGGPAAASSEPKPEIAPKPQAVPEPQAASEPKAVPESPTVDTVPLQAQTEAVRTPKAKVYVKGRIEEIIVTAQRREESVQDVPISISVLSQKELSNANVTNASDLATYTPSLAVNTRFGSENASFSLRGFVQDLRTTASVGTYFAEVVALRGQSSQNSGDGAGPGYFFDLQNIQVLKGPQGTLFGRNTTGGAVLLVPNKPSDKFEGYVELSGGDFDARRGQAVVNLPVTNWFKVRLSAEGNRRGGYLNNITGIGASDLGNVDYTAVRLSTVLNLSDSIENYTIFNSVDSNTHGYTSQLFACNPNANPLVNPFFVFTGLPCANQLAKEKASGNNGFYDLESTVPTAKTLIRETRIINTTTWTATDQLTFKNVFAWGRLVGDNFSDVFGTSFKLALDPSPVREFKLGAPLRNPTEHVTNQDTLVEELQLQGRSFGERLQWQAGVYYEHSTPNGYSGNNSAGFVSCELSTVEGDPSGYNCFDPLAGAIGSVLVQQFKTDYLNLAVYSQATYQLLDPLSLTVGLRYTSDRTKGDGIKTRYTFLGPVPLPPVVQQSNPVAKSQAPTGIVNLSYTPFEGALAYGKYSRGYRQGSVNLSADPGIDTFDPEKVNTYELGGKISFDGPVPGRFNFAVFYNDFTNQQLQNGYVSRNAGTTTAIFNAGKSRIQGAEIDAFFLLLDPLTLSLSYSYLNTKLLKQEDRRAEVAAAAGPEAALTFTPIARQGDSLPLAANNTVVATLNYKLPVSPGIGSIDVGATYARTGSRRTAATGATPYDILDPFQVVNLNLNWGTMFGSPLDLTVFATNVLNEKYATYVAGVYNTLGFESRQVGVPLMFGARLKYNFGGYVH